MAGAGRSAERRAEPSSQQAGRRDGPGLILVADGHAVRGQRIVDECSGAGYEAKLAPHGAAAIEVALATRPDVIVAQLDLPLVDALKLAEILRANPRTRGARFVFMGRAESLGTQGAVGDQLIAPDTRPCEVVETIQSLFARQGRMDSLEMGSDQGGDIEGDLGDVPLAELLQTFLIQRRSGTLKLQSQGERGPLEALIRIREGDVVDAEVPPVDGEKALFRLLSWRSGRFRFEPGDASGAPSILAPTRRLLVEGLRQLEEWDRLAPQLPPLSAPVKLTVKNAELPNIVHPLTQEVLLLLELYGTVSEVVDHCAFPDYQTLRTLHTLSERGIVQVGRAPAPLVESSGRQGLFAETQCRRLRDFVGEGGHSGERCPDARLLVVSSDRMALHSFAQLLVDSPVVDLSPELERGQLPPDRLSVIGRVAVDDRLGIELVQLPTDPSWRPFWPVAGHGALGTLFLLGGAVGDAVHAVEEVSAVLGALPRARTFHVVLLGKDERVGPDDLREHLSLIDEASLFLLPTESDKDPEILLRSLFTRVLP